jgi:hypothetical protein
VIGSRRRERIVQVTPCTGWVARYPVDSVDKVGRATRPVAAWAVLECPGGDQRVVGLTTDYERTSEWRGHDRWSETVLAGAPSAHLVRCDELKGFLGYDAVGRHSF